MSLYGSYGRLSGELLMELLHVDRAGWRLLHLRARKLCAKLNARAAWK